MNLSPLVRTDGRPNVPVYANEPLVDSVIVGKALYEGRLKLEEALQAAMVQTL